MVDRIDEQPDDEFAGMTAAQVRQKLHGGSLAEQVEGEPEAAEVPPDPEAVPRDVEE